jgi:hypothetical protein
VVANNFHIGAYQARCLALQGRWCLAELARTQVAINEGTELSNLSENAAVERDCYVYRSYIALGSHQVRLRACALF